MERSCTRYIQEFTGDGRTKKQYRRECDINDIVARAKKVGSLEPFKKKEGIYMDVSNVPDFMTAVATVRRVQEQFNQLDVKIRERFKNDPNEMVQFVSDKKNWEEAEKLGLIKLTRKDDKVAAEAASEGSK